MANKFIRSYRLDIDDRRIQNVRIRFRIEMFPNYVPKAEFEIYNLSPGSVNTLLAPGKSFRFYAGYGDSPPLLYSGVIANLFVRRDDVDIIFTVLSSYGVSNASGELVNKTFDNYKDVETILRNILSEKNVKIGQISIKKQQSYGSVTFSASLEDTINQLALNYQFTWHITNDVFYAFSFDNTSDKPILQLSPQSGLLETPTLTHIGMDAKTLLEPNIIIGDKFEILSTGFISGQQTQLVTEVQLQPIGVQRAWTVVHNGDTHGGEWFTELIGHKVEITGQNSTASNALNTAPNAVLNIQSGSGL